MEIINFDLVKKYDRTGPRYTSYPTAPHFSERFDKNDLFEEIARSNSQKEKNDLSLYFHLPYCDTLCYFCGCNMIVSNNRQRISKYVKYLLKEIDLFHAKISDDRFVTQLHWGGGTPTHLSPDEIRILGSHIQNKFNFREDAEISCEIDPRGMTEEHVIALNEAGFNRLSMGVQDFDPEVQKAVNRIQSEELTRQVIEWGKKNNFQSINLDLMYGLPHQSPETFSDTLDRIINVSPDRLTVFNYAHVPWLKKHMAVINENDLPTPDTKLKLLKLSIEKLSSAGYVFIGMDHFAKPEDELTAALNEKKLYRNFQGYSTRSGTDLYALGITGISQIGKIYSQNVKTEKEYFEFLDNQAMPVFKGYTLNDDDILRRKVIMSLMCNFELDFNAIENEFDVEFEKYFSWGLENLREMIDDGLVSIKNRKLFVKNTGRLLIRNVAMNFDGFIERKTDHAKYSRTV